jgi:hypothetical protein
MSTRSLLSVLLLGLGLPSFILYSTFFKSGTSAIRPIPDFKGYQVEISRLSSPSYQIEDVLDEGGMLRVNAWLHQPAEGDQEIEMQTLNLLYDVLNHTAQQFSVSIWMYRSPQKLRSELLGLAFFRALTAQTVYRNASALQ